MEKILEMIFKTGAGKTFKLTLDNPREDATPEEIRTAMELILSKDIFNIEGGLTEIKEVNLVSTQISPINLD